MDLEQYRLIFAGERCGQYAKIPLEQHLELLKLSGTAKEKILNGGKVALKSGLSMDEMRIQQAKLTKLGLVTQHQLQLSPEILSAGLRSRSPAELDAESPVNLVATSLAGTSFYARPDSGVVTKLTRDQSQNLDDAPQSASIRWNNYQFGGLLLIALCALLALQLQPYVISVAGQMGLPNIAQTVLGVLFLMASVATLPKLFQPLLHMFFEVQGKGFEVFEQPVPILGKRRFVWESEDNCGELFLAPSQASLISDELMFEWSATVDADVSGAIAADDIRNSITQGTALEAIQLVLKRLKPLLSPWQAQQTTSFADWSQAPASMVLDAKGLPVALIYEGSELAYRILRADLQNRADLHGFCLMILRRGLV